MADSWEILEKTVERIDKDIRRLGEERERVLRQDVEYAGYLDEFAVRGEGEPLSLRKFHKLWAELEEMGDQFIVGEDWEAVEAAWREYGQRLAELERLLLA